MNYQFEGTESAESKIAIIKRGLKQYFARPEGVDPEDCIGMHIFRTLGVKAKTQILTVFPLTHPQEQFDIFEIDKIDAIGDSPIGDALEEAGDSLPSVVGRTGRIKLISDGNWNFGIDPLKVLDTIKSKKIKVDVLQVGKRANRKLLQTLSSGTGGGHSEVLSTIDVVSGLKTNL
jgi:hypothetical protein